jgi:acyl-CoA reductase-like NAD-dependent aldehyde dehydrogenase
MSQLAIAGHIAEFIKRRDFRMLIRGDLVGAANDQTAETVNPSTGEPVSEVPEGTAEDVGRAVKTANRCHWPDPCC